MQFEESVLIKRMEKVKPSDAVDGGHLMTLHCQQCNAVLADSLHVCGEITCMDSIICAKVTDDVVVGDGMMSGHEGQMADCIYSSLKCRSCDCALGKLLHSAPSRLDSVRSVFLLFKPNVSCYVLDSSSMVEASTIKFDQKPVIETVNKVRQNFEVQLDRMMQVKSKLAKRTAVKK